MKNWWYYHKWYVIGGGLILCIGIYLIANGLGLFKKTPDIQIAYVGKGPLPEDTVTSLENAFASLVEDYNNDGEILVKIHQYTSKNPNDTDGENELYRQGSEISLIGDINDCDSYFFLMDNPEDLQKDFQILAMSDGSCPDDLDFDVDDKVFQWDTCATLRDMDLGTYKTVLLGQETTGTNQELLSTLYLGRRCFYNEKQCKYTDQCNKLWNTLKGAIQ